MMTLDIAIKVLPIIRPSKFIALLRFLALLILLQLAGVASAENENGVIVINSNPTIKHYELAQSAFTAQVSGLETHILLDDQSPEAAKEKIQQINPRFIYAIGSKAYLLAQEIADDRTIVFSSILNWQRLPGNGNVYGVSNELPAGMQLMTYRYLFPDIKKIGVVYSERFNKEWLADALNNAYDVGIEIIGLPITEASELTPILQKLLPQIDAFWLISDPVVLTSHESVSTVFQLGDAHQKPVIAYSDTFADLGATLTLSADIATMGMQAASIINDLQNEKQILKRIVDPAGSHIILNKRKAKEFGLQLNQDALGSVNQIIE